MALPPDASYYRGETCVRVLDKNPADGLIRPALHTFLDEFLTVLFPFG
jgi:hypothetical protein